MSISENIAKNTYVNTMNRPIAPDRPPIPDSLFTSTEVRGYAALLEVYERNYAEYIRNWSAYLAKYVELETRFRRDIEVENLTVENPKAQKLWDTAMWLTFENHDGEFSMMTHTEMQKFSDTYRELVKLIV